MREEPSIRNVNLLYLATFLWLFAGSVIVPAIPVGWRVVVNELVFLGLPLALYLVVTGRGLREAVRLRGVSWQVAGLSILIGLGLWRFDAWLATAVNTYVDYVIPLSPEALNVTLLDNVAMAVGTLLLAPVIEEFLFRGVLQSAYERRGPVRAAAASALLFVMIHQELAQSVGLVPLALALGYVTWRTRSVIPAILAHLASNGQAVLVSLLADGSARRLAFQPSALGAGLGLLVALVALWLLGRRAAGAVPERGSPRHGWLARNWPVLTVVPIYGAVIGLAVLFGTRPEALALGQRVELADAPWEGQVRWTYEIRNALDEVVGQAECFLTPESRSYTLDCSAEQSAYEADAPTGFFSEGGVSQRLVARWDAATLGLRDAEVEASFREGPQEASLEAVVQDGRLTVTVDGESDEAFASCYVLPAGDVAGLSVARDPCQVGDALLAGAGASSPLMVGEWPWRLSALPFELLYSREGSLLWPYRSVAALEKRAPAEQKAFVVVRTAEQLSTPAGDFTTWRVTVGERFTAWYAVEAPHHLVAFNDDLLTWELTDVE